MTKNIDEWYIQRMSILTDILHDESLNLDNSTAAERVCALAESVKDLAHGLYDAFSEDAISEDEEEPPCN